jgi:hypothetical protein
MMVAMWPSGLEAGQHVLDEHEVGLLASLGAPLTEAVLELHSGAAVVLGERRIGKDTVKARIWPWSRILGSSSVSAVLNGERVMLCRIMFMMQMDQTVPFDSCP